MHKIIVLLTVLSLAACTTTPPKNTTYNLIKDEMEKASVRKDVPEAVEPPLQMSLKMDTPIVKNPLEERFNIKFDNVPARQFFMAIVSGTRYNMLIHPEVAGTISAYLNDVTMVEALNAVRELYGYNYKIEGKQITIMPLTMQTSLFQVNYLNGNRKGSSETIVSGGSMTDNIASGGSNGSQGQNNNNNNSSNNGGTSGGGQQNQRSIQGSKISTTSTTDFWTELKVALNVIAGNGKDGRSVVISPQSGVVVIRAFPDELRNVGAYLKAMQLSVDRQVILEAKIMEVELNDSFQSGINWATFTNGANSRVSAGLLNQGTALKPLANGTGTSLSNGAVTSIPGNDISSAASSAAQGIGGLFGLAFQTSNFAGLISFLETQGTVHVLSNPRIATLNNQKAVLKVGTDEFFVTGLSTTTTSAGTSAVTTPSVILQPFFSGVVLDVTPQIDGNGNIILHVHPSVSVVTTVNKSVSIGAGSFDLPLASSNTSETDSIVRGRDGQVVAIGGLMRQASNNDRSQLPGVGNVPVVGGLFGSTNRGSQKRELVILLRPTIVENDSAWSQNILESQQNIRNLDPRNAQPWN